MVADENERSPTSKLLSPWSPTAAANHWGNRGVNLAVSFLRDYEASRPPTFDHDIDTITEDQLVAAVSLHHPFMYYQRILACIFLLGSCGFEAFSEKVREQESRIFMTLLNFLGLAIIAADIYLHHLLPGSTRTSSCVVRTMMIIGALLAIENITRLLTSQEGVVIWCSIAKPLVFYYVSQRARDAFVALRRISRIVARVLAIELLLILMFAAVGCRLFAEDESFRNLSAAWLALFKQSTTVSNPSVWMQIYADNKWSAVFFVTFIVISIFYMHSLVLSVVFSTFLKAASKVHERTRMNREKTIQMAFASLLQKEEEKDRPELRPKGTVSTLLLRETLSRMRPHYSLQKIGTLVDIMDPVNEGSLDFSTFRIRIRQALNASIRNARITSRFGVLLELWGITVAIVNFVYVVLVTSVFNWGWFSSNQQTIGTVVTIAATLETLARLNPTKILPFSPISRLNPTFDGLASVAAAVSLFGILTNARESVSFDCMIMGRALDMIRIMRFFPSFQDIVKRSCDVVPSLVGPMVLLATTLHIFVYIGMALWGGAVSVGSNTEEVPYLYDLYNFNSYSEGVVTMFQILVVNDWHLLSEVFLHAERCSSPIIVYLFFIVANLVGVSTMLNILMAFFVQTFVTKLEHGTIATAPDKDEEEGETSLSIRTSESNAIRRVSSESSLLERIVPEKTPKAGSDSTVIVKDGDYFEFDVYERQGFDKIMQTVAGGGIDAEIDLANKYCSLLDILQTMVPDDNVGYLIWADGPVNGGSHSHFWGIMTEVAELDTVGLVQGIHHQLCSSSKKKSLAQTFQRPTGLKVEVNAHALESGSTTLFVAKRSSCQPIL